MNSFCKLNTIATLRNHFIHFVYYVPSCNARYAVAVYISVTKIS